MFVRVKGTEPYRYLQIVENRREGKQTRQRVLGTLGRVDQLTTTGSTDALLRSLACFGRQVNLVEGYGKGLLEARAVRQIGPDLAFQRLWQTTGIGQALKDLLQSRRFEFPVERAIYLTVLHRLFESGSDWGCERRKRDLRIAGTEEMKLHLFE